MLRIKDEDGSIMNVTSVFLVHSCFQGLKCDNAQKGVILVHSCFQGLKCDNAQTGVILAAVKCR
jgi:hypothetical protein